MLKRDSLQSLHARDIPTPRSLRDIPPASPRVAELATPRRETDRERARKDEPWRATEFSTKDLPISMRGLYVDTKPGEIKCLSSGITYRSNDYDGIKAGWYNGMKRETFTVHISNRTGEVLGSI